MKQVCRICLKAITDLNFVAIKNVEPSQIKMQLSICVPEMVVDLVKDPIFCKLCVSALHSAYNFKILCLSTEQHVQNYRRKVLPSKSIDIEDLLHDLQWCTRNGASEINGGGKNTINEGCAVSPNMSLLLPDDENLGDGQSFNTESSMCQLPVTLPVDASNTINAVNAVANDFSKPAIQVSVDELYNLPDDLLENVPIQPEVLEQESEYEDITIKEEDVDSLENVPIQPEVLEQKSEYEEITIKEEDIVLPKLESSSYEGFDDNLFEDAKSDDHTADVKSINNEIAILQANIQTQSCSVKLTRLSDDIVHKFTSRTKYYFKKHELIYEASNIINAVNVVANDFSNPAIQVSVDELYNLPDDLLENVPIQPEVLEQESEYEDITIKEEDVDSLENVPIQPEVLEQKSEYEEITIKEEDIVLPKLESSSYEGFDGNLFEDAKSDDHTADVKSINNEIAILQANIQTQSCSVKLTRLSDDIVHKFTSRTKYYFKKHELIYEASNIINAVNVANDFSNPAIQVSVDELYNLPDDLLENVPIQPEVLEQESEYEDITIKEEDVNSLENVPIQPEVLEQESEYEDITIKEEDIVLPELESSSYEGFDDNLFEDAKSDNHTTDVKSINNEAAILKANIQTRSCSVKLTRLSDGIVHKFTSRTKYYLKKHELIHKERKCFSCVSCNFRTVYRNSLILHMRTHTGEKPFACNVCTYRSSQKENLKKHLRTHSSEKSFACNVCTYRSSRKEYLKKHLRTHSSEKSFACKLCTYRSSQKDNLKKHLLTHTGEKLFACNVCTYHSSLKTNLKKHLRTHSSLKPFACKVCTYRSSQKGNLKKHLQKHTGEKPFSCNVCTFRSLYKSCLQKHQQIHTR